MTLLGGDAAADRAELGKPGLPLFTQTQPGDAPTSKEMNRRSAEKFEQQRGSAYRAAHRSSGV